MKMVICEKAKKCDYAKHCCLARAINKQLADMVYMNCDRNMVEVEP